MEKAPGLEIDQAISEPGSLFVRLLPARAEPKRCAVTNSGRPVEGQWLPCCFRGHRWPSVVQSAVAVSVASVVVLQLATRDWLPQRAVGRVHVTARARFP